MGNDKMGNSGQGNRDNLHKQKNPGWDKSGVQGDARNQGPTNTGSQMDQKRPQSGVNANADQQRNPRSENSARETTDDSKQNFENKYSSQNDRNDKNRISNQANMEDDDNDENEDQNRSFNRNL